MGSGLLSGLLKSQGIWIVFIELTPKATVGQMTGAVGTQAAFGKSGILIQKLTMQHLGIGAVDVSNQIIQRDRHAEFVMWMANTVTTLTRSASRLGLFSAVKSPRSRKASEAGRFVYHASQAQPYKVRTDLRACHG